MDLNIEMLKDGFTNLSDDFDVDIKKCDFDSRHISIYIKGEFAAMTNRPSTLIELSEYSNLMVETSNVIDLISEAITRSGVRLGEMSTYSTQVGSVTNSIVLDIQEHIISIRLYCL